MQTLLETLNQAFDRAEQEAADQYSSHLCTMEDKDGNHNCPICYFRQRVKVHLGLMVPIVPENHGDSYDPELMSTMVVVNGIPKSIQRIVEIPFEAVVALAYGKAAAPERFTVQYTRGFQDKPSGTLLPGQSVRLKHNMEFDVVIAGAA